ncbi:MAG: hypothetical protein LW669_07495 [Sphingobacteriales bacterium]|nr:hypothetical protein [Sphingobacteriales bacterium]
MRKKLLIFTSMLGLGFGQVWAQKDSTAEAEIDFSEFADAESAEGTKRYCTNKVLGISPNKLISIGYDFQGKHNLETSHNPNFDKQQGDPMVYPNSSATLEHASGLRLLVNYPIVSNTKLLLTLGGNYWRTNYGVTQQPSASGGTNYIANALEQRGLTTIGINSTIFKPFNEKYFTLGFVSADANGDFTLGDEKLGDYLSRPKYSAALFFGKKRNDYSILAFGVSRTYRPGALGYIPLILFNHTFQNKKWGIESIFPARAAVRRTFNPRNILFFGYELEGQSYALINRGNDPFFNNLELRRSEIRPRITYEFALSGFIWMSVQAGYRINYNFNVDVGDNLRLLGSDNPYFIDNKISNPLYFQVSLNLVSP